MLVWIGLYSFISSQVFGEVGELAIDTIEACSPQWFLDHLLKWTRYKALQPAKALELEYVAKAFYLPASEGRGLGIATHKAQLRDRFHVDAVPDGPTCPARPVLAGVRAGIFHADQGDGNRRPEQVGQLIIRPLRGLVLPVEPLDRRPVLLGGLAEGDAP